MNADSENSESASNEIEASLRQLRWSFFQRTDWLSFALTTLLSLTVYFFTLIPNVGLENSGIFITGAMYPGVAHPPGYPPWALWAGMFIHLLPMGNIAWRAAVATAVAGALACGLIALMVSRGGEEIVKYIPSGLQSSERKWLRIICGYAAGMIFGLNGAFWPKAVIPDPWPLSILFLCVILCLLMRWSYEPERKQFLYAAALAYGLLLTNSQIQFAFMPAIPFLIAIGNQKIGRDMFLTGLILFLIWSVGCLVGILSSIKSYGSGFLFIFISLGVLAGLVGIGLAIKTRRIFSEWKAILICSGFFLIGLSLYFYLPLASMTNPPMNWGNSRTVEGFFHVITRGQYEQMNPTDNVARFLQQVWMYFLATGKEFGWPYLLIVTVPFCFLHRLGALERKWILGLVATCVFLAFLMLAVLNPDGEMQINVGPFDTSFPSASYVILSLWTGYGLMLLGILLTKPSDSRNFPKRDRIRLLNIGVTYFPICPRVTPS